MDEGDHVANDEQVRAREAVLELLASTLDEALALATHVDRSARLAEIVAACERVGFLGEAARRLSE